MSQIHVVTNHLTNLIHAETVLKNGYTWGADKQDVTIEALVAVAQHVLNFGAPVEISRIDGTPEYRITVEKL